MLDNSQKTNIQDMSTYFILPFSPQLVTKVVYIVFISFIFSSQLPEGLQAESMAFLKSPLYSVLVNVCKWILSFHTDPF